MDPEFYPLDAFRRLMRLWWLLALTGILGGIAGFAFHRLNPPMYESQAVYHASLDFTQANQFIKPNDLSLSQYDEDIALEAVHAALLEVQPLVIAAVNKQDITLSRNQFISNATVEREHAFWKVRFRNSDPKTAQAVVSIWTDEATQAMRTYQQDGRMKNYVFFELVSSASMPAKPTYLLTNQVVLAGGLAGLVIGILLTSIPGKTGRKEPAPIN
jgi:uncharacterized protein involved in exopolysaccharide biosynthesis